LFQTFNSIRTNVNSKEATSENRNSPENIKQQNKVNPNDKSAIHSKKKSNSSSNPERPKSLINSNMNTRSEDSKKSNTSSKFDGKELENSIIDSKGKSSGL